MAETLKSADSPAGAQKWHWYSVQRDLVQQGGLEDKDVMIDPLSVTGTGCGGQYKGMPFNISWMKDMFLMLSSQQYSHELVAAFSRVVEYNPFARYIEPDTRLVTVEWDKMGNDRRYQQLQSEGKLELTRLL